MAGSDLVRRFAVPVVLLFALSAGGIAMCGLPGDTIDNGPGIAGTYVVNGVDPLDVEYSGTVTIVERTGNEYGVEWIVTGTVQRGIGRLNGDDFVVDWETVASARGESSGTAEYVVGSDGVLRGSAPSTASICPAPSRSTPRREQPGRSGRPCSP